MEGLFCCVDEALWCLLTSFLCTQGVGALLKEFLFSFSFFLYRKSDVCYVQTHVCAVHVSCTCLLLGRLLFWLSVLASLGRARKGERWGGEAVSSLLTTTCHRGPLGVCLLPQVAGSHLLNLLPF